MSHHVLLTAWAFAPARTSGVYRAIALANQFAAEGWEVTVLTAPERVFAEEGAIDPSLRSYVDERIRVAQVPFSSGVYSSDIAEWTWARARHAELWSAVNGRGFPERGFGDWRSALTQMAERVHAERPVDLACGTASPSVDFIPGYHLHRRFGVPYVMDYRDAWTIDVFTGGRARSATSRAERWEKRLMSAAHEIWFVNEPIRAWHAAKYPAYADRMKVVTNGFDVIDGTGPAVPFTEIADGEPLTFGYIGTINVGQFPTEALLSGWKLARERSKEIASARIILRGHLGRTGTTAGPIRAFLDEAAEHGITYEGPVVKADVAAAYSVFDGLVLALASGPGVTSGKVFEFAGTGLPVVSVHDPDSAASTIMDGSPVWIPTRSLRPEDVAQAFISAAEHIRAQTAASRAEAVRWGAMWERSKQLESPVRALTRYAERKKA